MVGGLAMAKACEFVDLKAALHLPKVPRNKGGGQREEGGENSSSAYPGRSIREGRGAQNKGEKGRVPVGACSRPPWACSGSPTLPLGVPTYLCLAPKSHKGS